MLNQYKQAAIILTVVLIIILGTVNYVKDLIGQPIESAPEHLQVKAPTEKILHSQKIKDEQGNDIIKYLYASEMEVPAVTIKIDEREIKEDISKRTKNAQFFKKRGLHSGEALWSQDADTQESSTASLRSDYGAGAGSSTAPAAAGDNGAVVDEKEVWVGRFYAGEPFYKDAAENKWYQTETATTTAEEFSKQTKPNFLAKLKAFFNMNALADTGNYYAGAGDGEVNVFNNAGWDSVHDSVTGENALPTAVSMSARSRQNSVGFFSIHRAFLPIDTSGIDDEANITSATVNLFSLSTINNDNDGDDFIVIVGQTTQASATTLVTADYDQCGFINSPTEGSDRIDIDLIIASDIGPNIFTLNSTGISWIKKTTGDPYTMLGIKEGHDVVDSAISVIGSCSFSIYTSEGLGDYNPYLEVTYTVPAAPAKFRFDGGQMKIQGKVKFE